MNKQEIRKKVLADRKMFTESYIKETSSKIFQQIKGMKEYQESKTVMIYVSFENEIHTHDFIREMILDGKKVVTPICRNKDKTLILAETKSFPEGFRKTNYGILEIESQNAVEVDVKEIDVVITPGVAFSIEGKRLGYGAGYYDKMLAGKRVDTVTICPVYKEFILEDIPVDEHDIPVDYLVTDEKIIKV
ncbi:MAG: 5-formyltetrahydrofolate cyclo-ligase [Eubacteriaceae bacterium]|nr:5-formyltetrahydrofolate cyclo-ligase [Eubacteriaceae bacterium]